MAGAILVTCHVWGSRRKAGFHWIGDSLLKKGYDVLFLTDSLALIPDAIRRDYRFSVTEFNQYNCVSEIRAGLHQYIRFGLMRPLSRGGRLFNAATTPLFRNYGRISNRGLREMVSEADVIIYESSIGLMYARLFRTWNPAAKVVYRVSDDIRLFRVHPVVLDAEKYVCRIADLVSVPTPEIGAALTSLCRPVLHYHGVPKEWYTCNPPSPYLLGSTNVVFVGNLFLDEWFIDAASAAFPDLAFHIFGPFRDIWRRPNVRVYGEMPQKDLVPFVKHAAVGLNPCTKATLVHSNKMMQYKLCRLPVVMRSGEKVSEAHIFTYNAGDTASVRSALASALRFDRQTIDASSVPSWIDLTNSLLKEGSR